MSKPNQQSELTIETFFRTLREEHLKELESLPPEPEHEVSFARVIRIARGEVDPTWIEERHVAECAECRRLSVLARARAKLPSASPQKATKRARAPWGIPIAVEPFALMAGSKEPTLGVLLPGVYRYTISDRASRRATIELRPAGTIVRLRQVDGEPVLVESTGKPLGRDFREFAARPEQTGSSFLEGILLFATKKEQDQ